MYLLHNIGPRINSNYNTREEILRAKGRLTFDGVYRNVWTNRDMLKGLEERPILFVMGDFVGKDNTFDTGMPLEWYCTWDEIFDLSMNYGCELGWHTWTHRNLCLLTTEEVKKELTAPFPMKWVAYPYGNVDERVARLASEAGFEGGFSVTQGNDFPFQRKRRYLNW